MKQQHYLKTTNQLKDEVQTAESEHLETAIGGRTINGDQSN